MDEMKIRTTFMKKLIASIVKKALFKKSGCEIDIQLDDISITFDGDKAIAHISANAEMNKNELTKLIKKTGF